MTKEECPTFRRCCFCIPLRYGLLVWGYIKVILAALVAAFLVFIGTTQDLGDQRSLVIIWVGFFLCLVDFALSIVFVVGAHKKDHNLLTVFFSISMILLIIDAIWFYVDVKIYHNRDHIEVSVQIVMLALDAYLLLLVRSEILKLKANGRGQLVNNAADSLCQLKKTNGVSDVV